ARLRENAELEVLPLPLDEDTFTFTVYWEESQPKTAEREWLIGTIQEALDKHTSDAHPAPAHA
ncbi:MAG: hypothetical protein AAGH68_11880, partial [Pseudomonadota bacterium]